VLLKKLFHDVHLRLSYFATNLSDRERRFFMSFLFPALPA
jgi:hypothetical protein